MEAQGIYSPHYRVDNHLASWEIFRRRASAEQMLLKQLMAIPVSLEDPKRQTLNVWYIYLHLP